MQVLYTALVQSDVRAVVLRHEYLQVEQKILPLMSNRIFCWSDASHAALFPHMHAVLHHGGAGTLHMALQMGLPQGMHMLLFICTDDITYLYICLYIFFH